MTSCCFRKRLYYFTKHVLVVNLTWPQMRKFQFIYHFLPYTTIIHHGYHRCHVQNSSPQHGGFKPWNHQLLHPSHAGLQGTPEGLAPGHPVPRNLEDSDDAECTGRATLHACNNKNNAMDSDERTAKKLVLPHRTCCWVSFNINFSCKLRINT